MVATKVYFPYRKGVFGWVIGWFLWTESEQSTGTNRAGLSRKHILSAVDDSLKRLDTPYIDLYQRLLIA